MKMVEVQSPGEKQAFLRLPLEIYKNDPNWIQPLTVDIEAVFDPKKNKFFRSGSCKRWIVINGQGRCIGRIAAFINKRYKNDQPTGGIGFFECIDDQATARFMFDHCRDWLRQQGMEAMDGPINFGERDRWWGLQIEGFQEPLYGMNYNPTYYRQLFEGYGFQLYYKQICFAMKVHDPLQEKFALRHAEYTRDPRYSVRKIDKSRLNDFAKDFAVIYNKAWATHGGGKEIDEKSVQKMFQAMKPVMDEDIVWFAYYDDQPIAMWVNLPDLNQYFKRFRGRFGWIQKLYFLWLKSFRPSKRLIGLVFGIIPEFQGKGVDSYLILEAATKIRAGNRYQDFEMMWIGDFNPKMINIARSLGTYPSRTLATYRYLFDQEKEFKRHPILD